MTEIQVTGDREFYSYGNTKMSSTLLFTLTIKLYKYFICKTCQKGEGVSGILRSTNTETPVILINIR